MLVRRGAHFSQPPVGTGHTPSAPVNTPEMTWPAAAAVAEAPAVELGWLFPLLGLPAVGCCRLLPVAVLLMQSQ